MNRWATIGLGVLVMAGVAACGLAKPKNQPVPLAPTTTQLETHFTPAPRAERVEEPEAHSLVVALTEPREWRMAGPTHVETTRDTLAPASDAWPEFASAQMLRSGFEDGDSFELETFLLAAHQDGLMEGSPSEQPDEWRRYAALWADYLSGPDIRTSESWGDLADEIERAIERGPEGPVVDAMRVGLLHVHHAMGDESTIDPRELAAGLSASPDDDVANHAVDALRNSASAEAGDFLDLRVTDEASLPTLRAGLNHAVATGGPTQELRAALAAHPRATPQDRADLHDLQGLAHVSVLDTPWKMLVHGSVRECEGLAASGSVTAAVVDSVWTIEEGGPIADCLDGLVTPDLMRASIRLTVVR